MRIISAGLTDTGKKRAGNEDSYVSVDDIGLYIVADGMGGHAAGEVASQTAVQVIRDFMRDVVGNGNAPETASPDEAAPILEKLEVSVFHANDGICHKAIENPDLEGMGTTLSGFVVYGNQICLVHVGDSRVYRLRDGDLKLLTNDHSWVNEQVQRNMITEEEARNHRWRNVITRALGHKNDLQVDSEVLEALPEDMYLVCSDGLTGMVQDEALREVMLSEGDEPAKACRILVDKANDAGGTDNITLIIVKMLES
ncbi:MAG: Stp1/IreP family PP2C-type Ser/Thr phosphatase [Candidatus Sumerlaeia bacterium]